MKDLEREDYYLNIHHNASLYFDGLTNGFLKCETLKMKTCKLINLVFLQRICIIFGYLQQQQKSQILLLEKEQCLQLLYQSVFLVREGGKQMEGGSGGPNL